MRIIGSFILIALLVSSNGCITGGTVQRARGYTDNFIYVGDLVPVAIGDATFEHDYTTYVIQHVYAPGTTNVIRHVHAPAETHIVMVLPPPNPDAKWYAIAYRPNAAFYLLVPLTVPVDIVTSPFQFFLWLIFRNGVHT